MMFFRANVWAFVALYLLLVKGQSTQTVTVGMAGSFYQPASIFAEVNDTIVFQFLGQVHTVTQSSFENPCTPLPGGFNSGPAGIGTNNSALAQTWSLTITDASTPIWYFCEITRPSSHCAAGMAGVINPPSVAMFQQFTNAAKLVTGTPAPTASVVLTGQGAFATNSPFATSTAPQSSTTAHSTSSSTSTSATSTSSPTNTAVSSTNSHIGAIVGGSVGGGIALIGCFVLLWLFLLRKKNAPVTPESDEFFRYNPVSMHHPTASQAFMEAKRTETLYHNPSFTSNTNTNQSNTLNTHFSPVRRPPTHAQSGGPVVLEPPHLRRQPSQHSDLQSSNLSTAPTRQTVADQPSNVDIRALAQEVANVLYQNPLTPLRHKDSLSQDGRGQQSMTVQNQDERDYSSTPQTMQPPPNYRAATGPSPSPSPAPRGKGGQQFT